MKRCLFISISFIFINFFTIKVFAANDPLPSWNDGNNKQSIIRFVNAVTDKNHSTYLEPSKRIATIDNDGTLWVEKPMYTQFIFMFERIKQLAKTDPALAKNKAILPILQGKYDELNLKDLQQLFALTSSGISVEEYNQMVSDWLAHAMNPRFKKHYTQLIYQPMLEVIRYLQDNQFQVYIVSGGGQEFIRAFSDNTYHIAKDHVLGSTTKMKYSDEHSPQLIKQPEPLFICDKDGKPMAINLLIGQKPVIAFGNSDGDRQMLEWTQSNAASQKLMVLIHHDDAVREFAYGAKSKVGTFSDGLMKEAKNRGWNVVSMKDDWRVVFPS